ncbi:MAG: MFS transporter [Candidatus Bathyarchaeota archaeon]
MEISKNQRVDALLLSNLFKFFRELDRRIKVLLSFIGVHQFDQQLTLQYNSLYAIGLGANPVQLGLLTSIRSFMSSIFALPGGWLVDKYGSKKVVLLGLALMAAVAALYGLANSWLIIIPAFFMFGIGSQLILPYVDMLFITYGGAKNKSLIMSLSRTIWAIGPQSLAPIVAAILINNFGGLSAGASAFRPLYYLQLVLAVLVVGGIFVFLKAPKNSTTHSGEKGVERVKKRGNFIQDIREVFEGEKCLKRWIFTFALRQVETNVATAFIPLWLVMKGATPSTIGIMTAVGMISYTLLQIPVGMLSDKIGRKKTYILIRPFFFVATLLLIWAPSPDWLLLVGLLGGNVFGGTAVGIAGTSQIPLITMEWEMVQPEKRGRWHGIETVFGIVTFPAAIFGGILWEQGLGWVNLALPVLLDVLIVIPILLTIPETLGRTDLR